MYRRPKSLEVILAIRTEMSEEARHDVSTFVEMVRTGVRPLETARVVTREEGGDRCDAKPVADRREVSISDENVR